MRLPWQVGLAAAALTVVLSGCGSGSTASEPASTAATPVATTSPSSLSIPSSPSSPANLAQPATPIDELPVVEAVREPEAGETSTVAAPGGWGPDGPGADAVVAQVAGVVDGDTLRVRIDGRTERVRVIGIDTPELNPRECFGQEAASKMQSLAQSRTVWLEADPTQADRDRYDRLLRHVYSEAGDNLAAQLISDGFAVEYTYAKAYRHQSRYQAAQAQAQTAGAGLWGACGGAGVLADPAPAAVAAHGDAASSECDIKGNISSDDERIFHVPGQRHYDRTVITESAGERWFCSEAEATAAGWRKAKV